MRKPRKLAPSFVRRGTERTIVLRDKRREDGALARVHIRFAEDGSCWIHKGFGKPTDESYWELVHEWKMVRVKGVGNEHTSKSKNL